MKKKGRREKTRPAKRPKPSPGKKLTAKDVMNSWVLTVRDDMTLQELATFLTENEISGAPVTNSSGNLVGVVSLSDIVGSAAEGSRLLPDRSNPEFFVRGWEDKADAEELRQLHVENEGVLVREIMTPNVYSVSEGTPVAEIASTMLTGHIHRLLVTREGRVAGIVTTMDMLKLLLEPR